MLNFTVFRESNSFLAFAIILPLSIVIQESNGQGVNSNGGQSIILMFVR